MFAWLHRRRVPPESHRSDPRLGELEWDAEAAVWVAAVAGRRVTVTGSLRHGPDALALEAAAAGEEWLQGREATLFGLLESEARGAPPAIREEIGRLTPFAYHFAAPRGEPYLLVELDGGEEGRCWRVEFQGEQCLGLGYDD